MIASIILTFLVIVLFGVNATSDNYVPNTTTNEVVIIGFTFLEVILAIWSIVIMVVGVMKIQNFNVWKALVNVLLPFAVLVIIVLILVFMIGSNFNF